jgi:hypothetical protein
MEEEVEQPLMTAQAEEGNEHFEEWLKFFSQTTETETIAELCQSMGGY